MDVHIDYDDEAQAKDLRGLGIMLMSMLSGISAVQLDIVYNVPAFYDSALDSKKLAISYFLLNMQVLLETSDDIINVLANAVFVPTGTNVEYPLVLFGHAMA
jgi:hypothetical protein